MKEEDVNSWVPRLAGILMIFTGFIESCFFSLILVMNIENIIYEADYNDVDEIFLPIVILAMGIMGIIGGVFAFKRKKWPTTLAGAVLTGLPCLFFMLFFTHGYYNVLVIPLIFLLILVGVLPTVLIIESKNMFIKNNLE